jgi:predicted methyltransferase
MTATVKRFGMLTLLLAGTGCALQSIHTVDGHRVFNPRYLFYLESEERAEWQKPDEVLAALRLAPGQTVADIGAGGGYFTARFAGQLGETGQVYAVDVQDAMIERLQERVTAEDLTNVEVIRAEFDDPGLPKNACDLVFFSSVYKEINNRPAYMRKVGHSLKPGGRVAILEYRVDETAIGPPRNMRLSPEQITEEMETAGFHLVEEHDFLPRENFLVYAPME